MSKQKIEQKENVTMTISRTQRQHEVQYDMIDLSAFEYTSQYDTYLKYSAYISQRV